MLQQVWLKLSVGPPLSYLYRTDNNLMLDHAADYTQLHEGSDTRVGSSKAFALTVSKRNSGGLINSSKFGGASADASWFRTEIEGGRRQIIGGSFGATTAGSVGG